MFKILSFQFKRITAYFNQTINNFYPTYYVGEIVDWNKVSLSYHYNDNGYMKTSNIPVTQSMIQGFNVNTEGVRIITFKNNDSSYELRYYVKNKVTENITNSSFELGQYYDKDTVEETEHFIINIKKGSYIIKNSV